MKRTLKLSYTTVDEITRALLDAVIKVGREIEDTVSDAWREDRETRLAEVYAALAEFHTAKLKGAPQEDLDRAAAEAAMEKGGH